MLLSTWALEWFRARTSHRVGTDINGKRARAFAGTTKAERQPRHGTSRYAPDTLAAWSGSNLAPRSFKLNGTTCNATASPSASVSASASASASASVSPSASATVSPPVGNPFAGASGYRSPDFAANVNRSAATRTGPLATAMASVANYPTAIWLDSIAAITAGSWLARAPDTASQHRRGQPVVVTVVIDDLPNRDTRRSRRTVSCHRQQRAGPVQGGVHRQGRRGASRPEVRRPAHRHRDRAWRACKLLVTSPNFSARCQEAAQSGGTRAGHPVRAGTLSPIPNVFTYLDASHSNMLGYDTNLAAAVQLLRQVATGTDRGRQCTDSPSTAPATPLSKSRS